MAVCWAKPPHRAASDTARRASAHGALWAQGLVGGDAASSCGWSRGVLAVLAICDLFQQALILCRLDMRQSAKKQQALLEARARCLEADLLPYRPELVRQLRGVFDENEDVLEEIWSYLRPPPTENFARVVILRELHVSADAGARAQGCRITLLSAKLAKNTLSHAALHALTLLLRKPAWWRLLTGGASLVQALLTLAGADEAAAVVGAAGFVSAFFDAALAAVH